jgi:hypothetical protein
MMGCGTKLGTAKPPYGSSSKSATTASRGSGARSDGAADSEKIYTISGHKIGSRERREPSGIRPDDSEPHAGALLSRRAFISKRRAIESSINGCAVFIDDVLASGGIARGIDSRS